MAGTSTAQRLGFPGYAGATFAARLEVPAGRVRPVRTRVHLLQRQFSFRTQRRCGDDTACATQRRNCTGTRPPRGGDTQPCQIANIYRSAPARDRGHPTRSAPRRPQADSCNSLRDRPESATPWTVRRCWRWRGVPSAHAVATIGMPSGARAVPGSLGGASLAAIERHGETERRPAEASGRHYVHGSLRAHDNVRPVAVDGANVGTLHSTDIPDSHLRDGLSVQRLQQVELAHEPA